MFSNKLSVLKNYIENIAGFLGSYLFVATYENMLNKVSISVNNKYYNNSNNNIRFFILIIINREKRKKTEKYI